MKFPSLGIIAQLNNHHAPVKAVNHVHPLSLFPWPVRVSVITRSKSCVHDIWRADAHLYSLSATHEIATSVSKLITFSLAISKLLWLIFLVRDLLTVLREKRGS